MLNRLEVVFQPIKYPTLIVIILKINTEMPDKRGSIPVSPAPTPVAIQLNDKVRPKTIASLVEIKPLASKSAAEVSLVIWTTQPNTPADTRVINATYHTTH